MKRGKASFALPLLRKELVRPAFVRAKDNPWHIHQLAPKGDLSAVTTTFSATLPSGMIRNRKASICFLS
jgi:hypothetical protein